MSFFKYIDNGEGPTKLFIGGLHGNEGVTSLKFIKRIKDENLSCGQFYFYNFDKTPYISTIDKKYNESTRTYIFDGYLFNQSATIKFDYDKERLAKIMNDLSKLDNAPTCRINFGLKNEKDAKRRIVAKAYRDAELQAQAIADAAGKTLKQCAKVDFKPFTTEYVSQTTFGSDMMYSKAARLNDNAARIVNTFNPEDIELTETLYCLWLAE